MIHTTSIYLKTEGIKLPDGTVWGAETCEAYRIISEYGIHGYMVYRVIGDKLLNPFGDGNRVEWMQMKNHLNEWITYQIGIGNKVLRNGEEITEF